MKKLSLIAFSIICIITLSGFGADVDKVYSQYTQLPACPNERTCNNSQDLRSNTNCDSCLDGTNNNDKELVAYTISSGQDLSNNSYIQYISYPQLSQNLCDQNNNCAQSSCSQNQSCCSWHGAGVCNYSTDQIMCSEGSYCTGILYPPRRCP